MQLKNRLLKDVVKEFIEFVDELETYYCGNSVPVKPWTVTCIKRKISLRHDVINGQRYGLITDSSTLLLIRYKDACDFMGYYY